MRSTATSLRLERAGHESTFQVVISDVVALATELRAAEPALVVNLAEAFDGKSALESNVAALLNLLDLRYTGWRLNRSRGS